MEILLESDSESSVAKLTGIGFGIKKSTGIGFVEGGFTWAGLLQTCQT